MCDTVMMMMMRNGGGRAEGDGTGRWQGKEEGEASWFRATEEGER